MTSGRCTCSASCTPEDCGSFCRCEQHGPSQVALLTIAVEGTNTALGKASSILTFKELPEFMEPPDPTFDAACRAVAERIAALVINKQHDYGQQNIKMGRGMLGIAIRVGDKVARLQNLVFENKTPKNETLVDTLMDIAGYAIVGLMWNEGTFELPLIKE